MGILLCEGAVKTDLMATREFAARCGRRQLDDRLMIKPGGHRRVASQPPTAAQLLAAPLGRGELPRFMLGDEEYRLDSRNDNDDPKYVSNAFDQIFAHWRTTQNADFAEYFTESLSYALAQGTELNLAIYMTSDWLWHYRYCLHEQGRYAGLFEVDITALGGQLKQALHADKANLMADRRWAGAEWNSPNGLASFTGETVEITQKDVAILRGLATRAPPRSSRRFW